MVSMEVWEDLAGYLGMTFSMMLCFSMVPDMIGLLCGQDLGQRSIVPYMSLLLNGSLWTVYALLIVDYTVLITNVTGALCGAVYTGLYVTYLTQKQPRAQVYGLVSISCGIIIIVVVLAFAPGRDLDTAETWVGYVCAVFNTALYASPLALVLQVVEQKSTQGMSFPLSVTILAATVAWTAYAALIADYNILVPSAVGVGCALVQLHLFYSYGLDEDTQNTWRTLTGQSLAETVPLLDSKHVHHESDCRDTFPLFIDGTHPTQFLNRRVSLGSVSLDDARIAQLSGAVL